MRSTAMLTAALAPAAAVALSFGVAAPALAAPAAGDTTISSGMEIRRPTSIITEAKCTLGAVGSASRAYTAGHCGKRGEKIYTVKGDEIGTITSNLIGRNADIAVITLKPGLRVKVDNIDWSSSVSNGTAVSKSGATTGTTRGTVVQAQPKLIQAVECPLPGPAALACAVAPPSLLVNQSTYVVESTFRSESGDSGAGVRRAGGPIIGIVSSKAIGATDSKDRPLQRSYYTPLSRVPGNLR
ncbi:trypsin-like serine protease [Gordonia sp. (in: high G+C Gram-positive bacteria)]|uniref:trypsin-like serine protease n=1 Tax=Gordonia sp. (in: high G+C Gram-positive bacteria) TaxID=84139 RepID=UPI0039E630A9